MNRWTITAEMPSGTSRDFIVYAKSAEQAQETFIKGLPWVQEICSGLGVRVQPVRVTCVEHATDLVSQQAVDNRVAPAK